MSAGFLREKGRGNCRKFRSSPQSRVWQAMVWWFHPVLLTLLVAVVLSCGLIGLLEDRLRPVLLAAARVQTQHAVTQVVEDAVMDELDRQLVEYADLVCVEHSQDGAITAITTDMAALNRLRSSLMDSILTCVEEIDEEAIAVPMGSLMESEFLWGRGPTIKVRSFTIGTVSGEFESEFLSAGVNQTLHKIWLSLTVPTTILLPGNQLDVTVETKVCVAETVIVGKVPGYGLKT